MTQINESGRRWDLGLACDGATALADRTCWLDKLSVASDSESRLDTDQGFGRVPLLLDKVTRTRQPTQGLRGALDAYRDDAATFDAFKATVASYVEFQREHMRTEERELLPLVMDALTAID